MPERSKWILRLADTATTEDVMRMVEDFMRSRPGALWLSLPREWRPRPMFTSDDVSLYAVALVSVPSSGSTADETQTYELAGFFCAASQRLAFILSAAAEGRRRKQVARWPRDRREARDAATAGTPPVSRTATATAQ
jgi:hypothetical protein